MKVVIACFLVGSLASDTFVDGISDVDILLVLSEEKSETESAVRNYMCKHTDMECFLHYPVTYFLHMRNYQKKY